MSQMRAKKRHVEQLEHVTRLLRHVKTSTELESNLNIILEIYSTIVDAHGYSFYILDNKQNKYLLKAVRQRHGDKDQVAPSYSGLASYEKEVYQPPLSLSPNATRQGIDLIKEGEVPLLLIPIRGERGLIRIGPISRLPKAIRSKLEFVTDLLPQMLESLIETDVLKMKTDVVVTSEHALRSISSMALDSESIIQKTLGMFASALGIPDCFLLIQQTGGFQVPALIGWSFEMQQTIIHDKELCSQLWMALDNREAAVIHKGDTPHSKLALLLQDRSAKMLLISKFIEGGREGLIVCRVHDQDGSGLSDEQMMISLRTLSKQIAKLLQTQNNIKPMTTSYVELLKLLSRTIDNLSPYTVGYSELMSRYSIVIAQEMGLSPREKQDISLAAYLSNIGVLGLSEEIYLKEGKFSEIEYEKMKLHAEVGADIIEMLIGNKTVASYIRYHHERMDGNGYPAGLRGQQIPLGARIIAVVQVFLAKMNSRKYRTALPFDKALELLKSSTGSQLDPAVVDAFDRWLQRKRNSLRNVNHSLGPCWEMCCTPSEICATCPAFQQTEKNCWEVNQNNCQAHGKSCETCFVYTEAISRR
ncbi:HD-GYP domain-containing protein [Aneurinibacillus soli]|nr:HD domain-containing phosphohydrolase [Aneurinibacillus soli]